MKFTTTFSAVFVAMAGLVAAEEVAFGAADGSMFRANVNKGETVTGMFICNRFNYDLNS